ncbi:XTP/dITP diphosphatase [Pseudalkalibacillus caeni]|uniref:dITP/XTP pyrophosphatase n=1 Tax=Exobacillus caeni TaxID=2574798 RepID=A0A5R9FF40_9BACL|nr:XTP/dITP diphosphatase [Pseudalkalibacillus caeni]TLS39204.1 XTP/dITP diphosphatase [Pseudalkalibacillus caeni]
MNKVLIASKNKGKIKEFEAMFAKHGIKVYSLYDLEEDYDLEETGTTFEENAALKAETIMEITNTMVLADDSGLVVDALDGRPGVYSARYAGEEKNDEANLQKVLKELEGIPAEQRAARFVAVLALSVPGEKTRTFRGACDGIIIDEKRGENGFGYDPIFYLPDKQKTMAEISKEEKNKISHRAAALKKLEEELGTL